MKKKGLRKLALSRESILDLGPVSGAASAENCGYTSPRQCQLVPSVDGCATSPVGGCASDGGGCGSGQSCISAC